VTAPDDGTPRVVDDTARGIAADERREKRRVAAALRGILNRALDRR